MVQGDHTSSDWYGAEEYYCNKDHVVEAAFETEQHVGIATGCCSMDGTTGYRPDCDMHSVTYDEALLFCESYGYRLCTLQEMYDRITDNMGCSYDLAYNWVSDPCEWEPTEGMYSDAMMNTYCLSLQ